MKIQLGIKRLIALSLCVIIVLGTMTFGTSALEDTETSTEVVALREENIKHFDMGDGTYQAVVYAHPVHELDADGNWQNIDFGLSFT